MKKDFTIDDGIKALKTKSLLPLYAIDAYTVGEFRSRTGKVCAVNLAKLSLSSYFQVRQMKEAAFYQRKNKCAFTLAEVLITLGIIGIVAALTIPGLIQNYKKKETETRLKKFNSVMQQAIKLSSIENGDSSNWDKKDIPWTDGSVDLDQSNANAKKFLNTYLLPYMKNVKTERQGGTGATEIIFFPDASTSSFYNGSCFDMSYDVNGKRPPNKMGYDNFYFLFCPQSGSDKAFRPYGLEDNLTHGKALQKCTSDPINCGALLQMDNWEFKDDYPYKL